MSIGIVIDARAAPAADVAEEVARAVFAGGTVIFPNDTSYGIGCDPYSSEAIDRIYAAKGRPDNRPLTLHVATPQEFLEYAGDNPLAVLAAKRLLPGPVILLIAKPPFVSDELAAGLQTLAFRVPDDPLARALLDRCGPLAGTTVNRSGAPRYRGDGDHSMLPPADLLGRARADPLRPRILDRRSHRGARSAAARGRDLRDSPSGTLGSGRTSYDKGAHATIMIRSFWPLIAAAALASSPAWAATPPPQASARPPSPHPGRPAPPGAASAAGASFDLGVWTVHASSVDANFKTGDFSTPAKVVMTRTGGDVSADRANGNYKTQIVNLVGHVVMHDTQGDYGGIGGQNAGSNGPSTLTADKAEIDGAAKVYKAIGNVHYVQADTVVDADTGTLNDATHDLF